MPTIPTYTCGERCLSPRVSKNAPVSARLKEYGQNTRLAAEQSGKSLFPREGTSGEVKTRQNLLVSFEKGVQALDETAMQVQSADSPAAADWVLLRTAALAEEETARRKQISQELAQEKNMLVQVGAAALSAQALEAYLREQLPGYESRLTAAGISAESVRQEVLQVRRLAAQGCIKKAVASQNYQAAQGIYQKFEEDFFKREKDDLTALIRAARAAEQAQRYWDKSAAETDGSLEARLKWAQTQTEDTAVLETLSVMASRAKRQDFARQAQEYERLSLAASADEARRIFTLGSLDHQPAGATARAVSRFDEPAGRPSAEAFARLYFNGTEKENQRAFEKGEVSAREFFALSAASSARQAGEEDRNGAFLCAGIDAWGQKKGLPASTQAEIKRAVLCASADPQARLNALKQIKTYFD